MTSKAAEQAAEEALNKDEETRARPSSAAANEDKIELELFEVEIRRSTTDTVIAIVPQHEIPVLRALHGPRRVTKLEGAVDVREYASNAEVEWQRLLKSYYRVNSTNPVERVFLQGPDDLEQFGFVPGTPGDDLPKSVQRDNRKAAVAAKNSAKAK